jgi:hypothetical protein
MGKNMKKNMEEQMKFQKELILKQRQMQMATQIAMGRERFWYYSNFTYVLTFCLVIGAIKEKNPRLLAPLLPIAFGYAFQYDMLYGDMMERAIAHSDTLLVEHPLKFVLPDHSGIVEKDEYLRIMNIHNGRKMI